MAQLCISLLGPFHVTLDGEPVTAFESDKVRALLAYLAVEAGHPHRREKLAGLLWPEFPERSARANLSRALLNLRTAIGDRAGIVNRASIGDRAGIGNPAGIGDPGGIRDHLATPPLLLITHQTIQFNRASDAWVDVLQFSDLSGLQDLTGLEQATALYRGDFLEGFTLPGCPAFEEWALFEAERLRRLALQALDRLGHRYEAQGEPERALGAGWRQLELDPWRESAHRQVMRLLALTGQRPAALAQYEALREMLCEELGVEPALETVALYEQIRDGTPSAELARRPEPSPTFLTDRAAPTRPPVFVAREPELARLEGYLSAALSGRGQVTFVVGGPGRGKTALLGEFARRAMDAHPELLLAMGAGGAYAGVGDPYLPFREALAMLSGEVEGRWAAGTVSTGQARRIWAALPEVGAILAERGSDLVGTLLSGRELLGRARVAAPGGAGWLGRLARLAERESPAQDLEQSHLFEQVANVLLDLSARHPLLLVLDDLQWADLASISLLFHLGRRVERGRILLAGAYRPHELALGRDGQRHPLEPVLAELRACFGDVWLDLAAADEAGGRRFVDRFLDTEPNRLAQGFRTALFQRTGGHPLFTIELLRAMQGRGDLVRDEAGRWSEGERLAWEVLPAQVEATIAERIDRLPEALRQVLVVASVEGEEFTAQAVAQVQGMDELQVLRLLRGELAGRQRLVREQGEARVDGGTLSRYRFAHFLFQQHLYQGLAEGERRLLHGEIAAILEKLYQDDTEAVAVQLARHYSAAEQTEKAVEYLTQAGDRARGLYAHHEAVECYQQALDLLKESGDLDRAARTLMKLGLTHHTALQFRRARRAYDGGFALWQRAAAAEPVVPAPPAPHALRLIAEQEPLTLDPTVDATIGTRAVVGQLFSGLVELGQEMDVVPDIAQRWEICEAGLRYVFHLRDDACWSDGVPVTALDFRYAWLRALDPRNAPAVASLLYDIKGARAFHQGCAAGPEGVGVQALDDLTLIVELEGPTGYFLHLLTSMYPVPRHVIEAHGEAWTEPGNLVTNGPFRLENQQPRRLMTFSRNSAYHGRFKGNVRQVKLHSLPDPESRTRLEMYETDDIDVVRLRRLSPTEMERARQGYAGEYVSLPWLATYYVGFDVSRSPLDDPRIRRAFVLAIDREVLGNVVLKGFALPATGGLVPHGMPGHSPGIGLPYDPDQARQLLSEAGYPSGRGFPILQALHSHSANDPIHHYLQIQWREILGVVVTWEAVESGLLPRLRGEPGHVFLSGWLADYPDPDTFLRRSYFQRQTRWRNQAYERLVEEARRVMDQAQRMELYRQADRILIEEAVITPIRYGRSHLLVKPWIKRFPTSAIKPWFWKDVVIEPH